MTKKELKEIFKNVDESQRQLLETMFEDFIFEREQLDKIKPLMSKMPRGPKEAEQVKFYTKMYSDISQRHDNKIKIFSSMLGKHETEEEDEFIEWLNKNQ